MGIPDHLTCLLRNLYAGQEATVRTGHGTTRVGHDWATDLIWSDILFYVCMACPCQLPYYSTCNHLWGIEYSWWFLPCAFQDFSNEKKSKKLETILMYFYSHMVNKKWHIHTIIKTISWWYITIWVNLTILSFETSQIQRNTYNMIPYTER